MPVSDVTSTVFEALIFPRFKATSVPLSTPLRYTESAFSTFTAPVTDISILLSAEPMFPFCVLKVMVSASTDLSRLLSCVTFRAESISTALPFTSPFRTTSP